MPLLDVHEAGKELGVAPASLYNRPFRAKLGLIGTKIGRNLRFDSRDIARVLEASREKLPPMPRDENSGDDVD